MKRFQIEKDDYETWAIDKFIEYASCDIDYSYGATVIVKRIVFGVFVGGGFKVTCGNTTLYEGNSFSAAQGEFNAAVQ